MSFLTPQCSELAHNVNSILDLVAELNTNRQDVRVAEAYLKNAMQRVDKQRSLLTCHD
ncbi:hypothetical protein [Pleurocapsa sp. FMAR1]|uniref:hypothetical protein n=1 Tax=Pleurocapsa sp. FMAR1 TaxID=3040204 RepID=UPI0029C98DC8|nr:hypothetical protein [Pleurocapsa sp. FMAR1]